LLRKQALDVTARPLVVMTPKGFLRIKQASSSVDDLARGEFRPVIDDPAADHNRVTRLVLCQGKITTTSSATRIGSARRASPVARIEQLYPFRRAGGGATAQLSDLREVVWARRSRRTWGVAPDPPPARGGEARGRAAPLRRAGRGARARVRLSHRARARAGPIVRAALAPSALSWLAS